MPRIREGMLATGRPLEIGRAQYKDRRAPVGRPPVKRSATDSVDVGNFLFVHFDAETASNVNVDVDYPVRIDIQQRR